MPDCSIRVSQSFYVTLYHFYQVNQWGKNIQHQRKITCYMWIIHKPSCLIYACIELIFFNFICSIKKKRNRNLNHHPYYFLSMQLFLWSHLQSVFCLWKYDQYHKTAQLVRTMNDFKLWLSELEITIVLNKLLNSREWYQNL